jgi:hypothetical protein
MYTVGSMKKVLGAAKRFREVQKVLRTVTVNSKKYLFPTSSALL